jgi:hypothetical protein
VIGIVVADYRNADARAAWMMPIETILGYLPDIAGTVVLSGAGTETAWLGQARPERRSGEVRAVIADQEPDGVEPPQCQ